MLYLYTLLMFAWDLDEDTHTYFRHFLNQFINLRKVSKGIRTIATRSLTGLAAPVRHRHLPDMRKFLHNTSQVTVGGGNPLTLPEDIFTPNMHSSLSFHIPIDEIHIPRNYMIDYLDIVEDNHDLCGVYNYNTKISYPKKLLSLYLNLDNDTRHLLRSYLNTILSNKSVIHDMNYRFNTFVMNHRQKHIHHKKIYKRSSFQSTLNDIIHTYQPRRKHNQEYDLIPIDDSTHWMYQQMNNPIRELLKYNIMRDKKPLHTAIPSFITPIETIHRTYIYK